MADALELLTSLTSLDGCDQYSAIRTGGLQEINLACTELGIWASLFLERSASTLTKLDLRCAPSNRGRGGGKKFELMSQERSVTEKNAAIRIRHRVLWW